MSWFYSIDLTLIIGAIMESGHLHQTLRNYLWNFTGLMKNTYFNCISSCCFEEKSAKTRVVTN